MTFINLGSSGEPVFGNDSEDKLVDSGEGWLKTFDYGHLTWNARTRLLCRSFMLCTILRFQLCLMISISLPTAGDAPPLIEGDQSTGLS